MNDLLFYTLLIALLYYFFIYLPSQKKLSSQPSNQPFPTVNTQATQTETIIRNEEPEINCPGPQFIPTEDPELEKTVNNLIKNIQELKQELDK